MLLFRKTLVCTVFAAGISAALSACGGGGSSKPVAVPTAQAVPSSQPTGSPGDIDWPTFGFTSERTGENTSETQLTPSTVGKLHLVWSHKIGDTSTLYADTQPIVAANVSVNGVSLDVVYAGDEHGYFVALNAINGAILWTKHLGSIGTTCNQFPDGVFGITSSPVIDRSTNRIYVADGTGKLMAFDLATGNTSAGWPASGVQVVDDPSLDHVWSALTFDASENLLFVPTASYCDRGQWNGALRSVNGMSAAVTNVFYFGTGSSSKPTSLTNFGGGVWGWGGIAIDAATHDLYGASGNTEPTELTAFSDSMNEWSPSLAPIAWNEPPTPGGDDDFGGSAVLYEDAGAMCVAAQRKDGYLFLFDRTNVGAGPTVSLALGSFAIATPAHSSETHLLYVNNPTAGSYAVGLYAFQTSSHCTLGATPAWSHALSTFVAPPTVAGGVIYDPAGAQLLAFNAATGAPLWNSGSSIIGTIQNGASVVNGRVYVVDWNDTIYAFSL